MKFMIFAFLLASTTSAAIHHGCVKHGCVRNSTDTRFNFAANELVVEKVLKFIPFNTSIWEHFKEKLFGPEENTTEIAEEKVGLRISLEHLIPDTFIDKFASLLWDNETPANLTNSTENSRMDIAHRILPFTGNNSYWDQLKEKLFGTGEEIMIETTEEETVENDARFAFTLNITDKLFEKLESCIDVDCTVNTEESPRIILPLIIASALVWKQQNDNSSDIILPQQDNFDAFLETYVYSLFGLESVVNENVIGGNETVIFFNETEAGPSTNLDRISFNIPNFLENNTIWEKLTGLFNAKDEEMEVTTNKTESEPELSIDNETNELDHELEILTNETKEKSSKKIERINFNIPNFLENNTIWEKLTGLFNAEDEETEVTTVPSETDQEIENTVSEENSNEADMELSNNEIEILPSDIRIYELKSEVPVSEEDSNLLEVTPRLAIPIAINSTHIDIFPNFFENNTFWDKISNNTVFANLISLFTEAEETSEFEETLSAESLPDDEVTIENDTESEITDTETEIEEIPARFLIINNITSTRMDVM